MESIGFHRGFTAKPTLRYEVLAVVTRTNTRDTTATLVRFMIENTGRVHIPDFTVKIIGSNINIVKPAVTDISMILYNGCQSCSQHITRLVVGIQVIVGRFARPRKNGQTYIHK